MVRCARLGQSAVQCYFPATKFRTDDGLLKPGDIAVTVTIEIPDGKHSISSGHASQAVAGSDMPHGVISRRVFFTSVH